MASSLIKPNRVIAPSRTPAAPIDKQAADARSYLKSRSQQPVYSRLADPNWKPYRNSQELALQVYELTHSQPW